MHAVVWAVKSPVVAPRHRPLAWLPAVVAAMTCWLVVTVHMLAEDRNPTAEDVAAGTADSLVTNDDKAYDGDLVVKAAAVGWAAAVVIAVAGFMRHDDKQFSGAPLWVSASSVGGVTRVVPVAATSPNTGLEDKAVTRTSSMSRMVATLKRLPSALSPRGQSYRRRGRDGDSAAEVIEEWGQAQSGADFAGNGGSTGKSATSRDPTPTPRPAQSSTHGGGRMTDLVSGGMDRGYSFGGMDRVSSFRRKHRLAVRAQSGRWPSQRFLRTPDSTDDSDSLLSPDAAVSRMMESPNWTPRRAPSAQSPTPSADSGTDLVGGGMGRGHSFGGVRRGNAFAEKRRLAVRAQSGRWPTRRYAEPPQDSTDDSDSLLSPDAAVSRMMESPNWTPRRAPSAQSPTPSADSETDLVGGGTGRSNSFLAKHRLAQSGRWPAQRFVAHRSRTPDSTDDSDELSSSDEAGSYGTESPDWSPRRAPSAPSPMYSTESETDIGSGGMDRGRSFGGVPKVKSFAAKHRLAVRAQSGRLPVQHGVSLRSHTPAGPGDDDAPLSPDSAVSRMMASPKAAAWTRRTPRAKSPKHRDGRGGGEVNGRMDRGHSFVAVPRVKSFAAKPRPTVRAQSGRLPVQRLARGPSRQSRTPVGTRDADGLLSSDAAEPSTMESHEAAAWAPRRTVRKGR